MVNKRRKIVYIADHYKSEGVLLESVVRQYEPALRRFLRARLAAEEEREDIFQEVFLKLTKVDDLAVVVAENSGNTLSYLFSVASNLIVDAQRKAATRRQDSHCSYQEEEHIADQSDPEVAAAVQQQLDAMMHVLERLKPKCQQVFTLSRFKHMSYPEIAKETGLSVSSVERYITIALAAMRKRLKR